jgi:hypothetical protein
MPIPPNNPRPNPNRRLDRGQQLTLNTWRLASARLKRVLDPAAVLEHAALHATFEAVRDVDRAHDLFARHATAEPEFALIASLVAAPQDTDLPYDILDTAFLMRWNELVADGTGPEELPPLRPASTNP